MSDQPKQLLAPGFVARLLMQLTDEEAGELHEYSGGDDGDPDQYCERASEWLRKRFNLDRHTEN